MNPTIAVISSRSDPARLRSLLAVVVPDAFLTVVVDVGVGVRFPDSRILVVREDPEASVYRAWNTGWRIARGISRTANVAILAEDVRILPGTLDYLARALRSRDDLGAVYADATARLVDHPALPKRVALEIERDPLGDRELDASCFLARAELPLDPPFDEGFRRWYGDTTFDEVVRLLGFGVARVNRVPLERDPVASTQLRPDRGEPDEDGRRFDEQHVRVERGRWWPVSEAYGK